MRIATKEEFLTQSGTTVVGADPVNGIPEQTYLHYDFSDWGDARSFTQGYWAGIAKAEKTTENIRQLNKMFKHAVNYGVAEQSGNSQAPAEEEKKDILEERQETHGEFKEIHHNLNEFSTILRNTLEDIFPSAKYLGCPNIYPTRSFG